MSHSARAAVAVAHLRFGAFHAATITPDAAASRYALAAGAVVADCVCVDDLQKSVREIALLGGDLGDGDLLAARLAEAWQGALIFDVLDAESDGKSLRVIRDCGRGAKEILSVIAPAVLVISPESPVRMYVSQHRRQCIGAARLKSTAAQAAQAVNWEPAQPRAKTGNLAEKNRATAGDRMLDAFGIGAVDTPAETPRQIIAADTRTCAEHLLRYLAHHGMLSRHRISAKLLDAVLPAGLTKPLPEDATSPAGVRFAGGAHLDRRVERGPRSIEGKSFGLERRPREAQSPTSAALSLPDRIARRPRDIDSDVTRIRRSPTPANTTELPITRSTSTASTN